MSSRKEVLHSSVVVSTLTPMRQKVHSSPIDRYTMEVKRQLDVLDHLGRCIAGRQTFPLW
jgi:hypothetical protein